MQTFIDSGDLKVNEIKVRLDKLSSILSKYESAQDELECLDEADYCLDREEFENQYFTKLKQSSLNSCTQLTIKVDQLIRSIRQHF